MVDVVPVPNGLEQPVGKAKRQDVLRRFLPQEVVDAEHLLLAEDLVHAGVEGLGTGQVGAEGLLHDDPGPLRQAGRPEGAHHGPCRGGGDAQVVEAARLAAEGGLQSGHLGRQSLDAGTDGDIGQATGEVVPLLVGHSAPGTEVIGCHFGELAPPLVVELVEGGADDPAFGEKTLDGQVEQRRQQLALCQVTGGSEEHDEMRL